MTLSSRKKERISHPIRSREGAGARTRDTRLKRAVLYLLSYALHYFFL